MYTLSKSESVYECCLCMHLSVVSSCVSGVCRRVNKDTSCARVFVCVCVCVYVYVCVCVCVCVHI